MLVIRAPRTVSEAIEPVESRMIAGRSMTSSTSSTMPIRSIRLDDGLEVDPFHRGVEVDRRHDRVEVDPPDRGIEVDRRHDRVEVDPRDRGIEVDRRHDRVQVDPPHRRVEVDAGDRGVEVDGRDDLVEVDVVLDQPGQVEPLTTIATMAGIHTSSSASTWRLSSSRSAPPVRARSPTRVAGW